MSVNLLVVVSFLFSFTAISPARAVTNNVTAYGAIPNDGLGDADAIQAAINAANSGDTVFLPEGTFNLDKSIQLVGGVYLAGSGDGVSQTKLSGPAGLGHDLQKQIQAYDFAGIEDIRFENIEIEVEGSAIASQSNRFIQDCTFLITDWDVIRTIYLNGEDVTDYSNRVKNVTIENCFFDHTRMAIEGGLEDGIIRNNVFEGCLNGLKLYHLSNVTIAENSITAGDAPNLGDEVRCGIKIMSEKSFTPIFRGVQIISNYVNGVAEEGISMEARPTEAGIDEGDALFKVQGFVVAVERNQVILSSVTQLNGIDISDDILDCGGYSLVINDDRFYGGLILDIDHGSVTGKTVSIKTPLPSNLDDLVGSSYILGGVFYGNKTCNNVVENTGRSGIDLYGPAIGNEIIGNSIYNCNTADPGNYLRGGIILKNYVVHPNIEKWMLPVMRTAVLNNEIYNGFLKVVNIGTSNQIPVSPSGNILGGNIVIDEDLPDQPYDFTAVVVDQEFTPRFSELMYFPMDKLDENDRMLDESPGEKNHAVQGGGTVLVPVNGGRFGKCIENTGGDTAYLKIPYDEEEMELYQFSVSFWYNPAAVPAQSTFLVRRADTSGYIWTVNHMSNGDLGIWLVRDGDQGQAKRAITTDYSLNQWQYVTATFEGQEIRLYLDGELKAEETITDFDADGSGGGVADLMIGYRLNGKMDDVRVYGYALSEDEIDSRLSLVSHWEFNGSADDDASLNNLTEVNSPSYSTNSICGQSFYCDPTSDAYGMIDDVSQTALMSSSFTITAWVRMDEEPVGGNGFIMKKWLSGGGYNLLYSPSDNQIQFHISSGSSSKYIGYDYVPDNRWIHVCATYDGDTNAMKLYINGQFIAENVHVMGISTADVVVGQKIGLLDDLRYYGEKLPVEQIRKIMAFGDF